MRRLALIAAVLLASRPLPAQEVAGVLVDGSGAVVPAARLVLVDSAGGRAGSVLSGEDGGFRLRAPAAGRYRVRAERVGFASSTSAVLELREGTVTPLRLAASAAAVSLEGITVQAGSSRCRLARESGQATALLWEEARKALDLTEGAREVEAIRFDLVEYRRELDAGSLAVISERRSRRAARSTSPFASTSLDTLLERGFVRPRGDSVSWDAPDAQVLLSPRFQATHCLYTVAHPDSAGLVGLGFRPVGNRRAPDVTGTLWLHRATARLRHLEYGYVNAGTPGRHPQVGGRVEFEQVGTGHWVVRRWWIRIPAVNADAVFGPMTPVWDRLRISRIVEVGGEITGAGGQPVSRPGALGRITGVVWDSLARAPLAGAEVTAQGTPWVAYTDSAGRFTLPAMPAGVYRIGFTHSHQAATGQPAVPALADLAADTLAQVSLAVPGEQTVIGENCPGMNRSLGLVAGVVTHGDSALAEAEVEVYWSGLAENRRTVIQQTLSTRTRVDGSFAICEVPTEVLLELRVRGPEGRVREELAPQGRRVRLHPVRL